MKKKFLIEWETDFCDNFCESSGETLIEAENEVEAAKKFKKFHAVIMNIKEVE